MSVRPGKPIIYRPRGVCDAIDGTNARPGSMASLQNLILSPSTQGVFVPRPAALGVVGGGPSPTLWGSFVWGAGIWGGFDSIDGAAQINALLVVGNVVYGMIASTSGTYSGLDVPFAYNLLTQTFAAISIPGGTASLPTTPATGSDWTPPCMAQVAQRIIVTHPGFSGGNNPFFGWLDVSGFSSTTVTGNTHSNTTVDNLSTDVLTAGWTVGMTFTDTTHSDIPAGTTIKSIAANGLSLTLSQAATGGHTADTFTVAGGTQAAPLWAAGNTNGTPLTAVPVSVIQFNGRAYYAVGTGVQFSDSGSPCQITNATQALVFQNGLMVTAFGGLPMFQTTGGILQSIIAFQGDASMQQITGDPATTNLTVNNLGIGVGTNAPNTICNTPGGLAFVSADGLRVINFGGQVSDPIGKEGDGIVVPFLNAINPTRMCAAYNENVLRISVQNGALNSEPVQEYWYHWAEKIFTGPHTFPAALIEAYQAPSGATTGHGFVMVGWGIDAELYSSEVIPTLSQQFTENGNPIICQYQPTLLPAAGEIAPVSLRDAAIAMALPPQQNATVIVTDQNQNTLGTVSLQGDGQGGPVWGAFNWGAVQWGSPYPFFRQRVLPWSQPIVFTQANISVTVAAAKSLSIGDLYMRLQPLNSMIYAAPILTPPPAAGTVVTQG